MTGTHQNPQTYFSCDLPAWVIDEREKLPACLPDTEEQMRVVIDFSRLNFEHNTGGPFAAGVFEMDSGRIIALGVNRVVPANLSVAHAEIVALSLAQQSIGCFDLGAHPGKAYRLVVNARPCAMCCGAIPWSGIASLVVGASGEQVERLAGFDEGPIHPQWQQELRRRGIDVHENVRQAQAASVLELFGESTSTVYNSQINRAVN